MEIERFMKSEKVYKDQKLRVKSVVAADFEERVLRSDKHVLVNFYSMECDSSRRFNELFERVAKMPLFQDTEFYQVNALKNEIPKYKVHYYPSVYSFHRGNSVRMAGDNTEANLVAFINQNK